MIDYHVCLYIKFSHIAHSWNGVKVEENENSTKFRHEHFVQIVCPLKKKIKTMANCHVIRTEFVDGDPEILFAFYDSNYSVQEKK